MSDFALEHKEHNLRFEQRNYKIGRFIYAYCNDCNEYLGNINLNVILDQIQIDE